jgi:hypothetical protein
MRSIIRSPALIHVLILAIAAAPIAYALAAGAGSQPLAQAFETAAWTSNWIAFLVIAIALVQAWFGRRQVIDDPARDRRLTTMLFGFDLLIDSIAFQLAVAWPVAGIIFVAVAITWTLLWSSRSIRTHSIMTSAVIMRDQATVFSFVANDENAPRYMPMIESIEKLTSGPIRPGTRYRGRARLGPNKTFEAISEVIDYEPNSRVTSRVMTWTPNLEVVTFEPVPGGTLLQHRFESETAYSSALLGLVILRGLADRRILAMRNAAWAKLKQILEGGPYDREPLAPLQ